MKQIPFDSFAKLHETLTFDPPDSRDGWTETVVVRSGSAFWVGEGAPKERDSITLWSRASGRVSIDSLKSAVVSWLGYRSLPLSEDLATVLIAISTLLRSEYAGPTQFFCELDKLITTATVKHVAILNAEKVAPELSREFSGFRYGGFRASSIASRCRKAGSDNIADTANAHDGVLSLESPESNRPIIDIATLGWRIANTPAAKALLPLMENYFQVLASGHIKWMWNELDDAMLIPNALQGGHLNLRQFESIPGLCYLTIYDDFGIEHKMGHVGTQFLQPKILTPTPRLVDEIVQGLEATYSLSSLKDSPLRPLVTNLSRSISRAWDHAYNGRLDEGCMFMMIAIEQVLSEMGNANQSVSNRGAVISHQQLGMSFDDARKLISALYDKRSRLVHDGTSPSFEDFDALGKTTRILLETLLRYSAKLATQRPNDQTAPHKHWLKRLDLIGATIEAGETPSNEIVAAVGVRD